MAYIPRRSRNIGFHDRKRSSRSEPAAIQRAVTKACVTLVTIKRHARAFVAFAREHFPAGMENVRNRVPGVLHLHPNMVVAVGLPERTARKATKLRAGYAARMVEG